MSKKYHRRKPLSEYERERRKKLRLERKTRKKREKRIFWLKLLVISIIVVLAYAGMFIIDILFGGRAMMMYLVTAMAVTATLTDRCGIRRFLFSLYPDRFWFAEYLKRSYPERSFPMELTRTVSYYSMCMMIFCWKFIKLWGAILIITMVVGFVYIIFDRDDCYTFDKTSKFSDTTIFLVLSGMLGLGYASEVRDIPLAGIAVGTLIVTLMYIIFGENKKKLEQTISVALFSDLDITTAVVMIKLIT